MFFFINKTMEPKLELSHSAVGENGVRYFIED